MDSNDLILVVAVATGLLYIAWEDIRKCLPKLRHRAHRLFGRKTPFEQYGPSEKPPVEGPK